MRFFRAIFFTKVPLGGYYRYKDMFQIFPSDLEKTPKSSFQKHFPNILEFWISDEDKVPLPEALAQFEELFGDTNAMLIKQDKILGLLSTFTNNLFFRYTDMTGNWGMPMVEGMPEEQVNNMASVWCLKMFHFPELPKQFKIEKFTEMKIPPIKTLPHKQFYVYYPNLDLYKEKDIVIPETLDQLFDSYFSLDLTKNGFVDSAISYTVSAIELMNDKKTLSLLSSFTAMETMVNLEFRDAVAEQCPTCGQLKYSVAKKFRDYLLKYIGHSEKNKKKFNLYYSFRSKIVHTGRQLKTESLFADVPKDEHSKEILTRTEILQIGKLAITNWLLTQPNGVNSATELTLSK